MSIHTITKTTTNLRGVTKTHTIQYCTTSTNAVRIHHKVTRSNGHNMANHGYTSHTLEAARDSYRNYIRAGFVAF